MNKCFVVSNKNGIKFYGGLEPTPIDDSIEFKAIDREGLELKVVCKENAIGVLMELTK